MRQSVQALAVVTFDAPAETDVHHLWDDIADALIHGTHATVEPTAVELRAVREEAAMFNSNGDQWTVEGGGLARGGEMRFGIIQNVHKSGADRVGHIQTPASIDADRAAVCEALNFIAGRRVDPEAEKLRKALEAIRDIPACGNSDPDTMASALDSITAICAGALGWEAPLKPVPVMKCDECGNDGDDTLTIGIDGVWDAGSGRWTLHYNGQGLDCSACDYRTRLDGDAFPDGLEISPDGREVLL